MKTGDYVRCSDEKDLIQTLEALSSAGYGAVRTNINSFELSITSVPEETQAEEQK